MSEERNSSTIREHQIEADLEAIARDEARLGVDVTKLEHDLQEERRHVDISVNRKSVRLRSRRITGLEIKQAAVSQGVAIDVGFQLWEELEAGRERQIGDNDEVIVREGACFTAIAPDDNS